MNKTELITKLAKKAGIRLMGKWLMRHFPYRDNFFLDDSRAVRAATAVASTQVSPYCTRAAPSACLARRPTSIEIGRPAHSVSTLRYMHYLPGRHGPDLGGKTSLGDGLRSPGVYFRIPSRSMMLL